jgi:hypothetical protein
MKSTSMMNGSTIEEGSPTDFKRCALALVRPFPRVGDKYTLYADCAAPERVVFRFQIKDVDLYKDGGWIKITPNLSVDVGHGVMTLSRFLEEEDFGLIVRGWQ